jgi:hypothetical protein
MLGFLLCEVSSAPSRSIIGRSAPACRVEEVAAPRGSDRSNPSSVSTAQPRVRDIGVGRQQQAMVMAAADTAAKLVVRQTEGRRARPP